MILVIVLLILIRFTDLTWSDKGKAVLGYNEEQREWIFNDWEMRNLDGLDGPYIFNASGKYKVINVVESKNKYIINTKEIKRNPDTNFYCYVDNKDKDKFKFKFNNTYNIDSTNYTLQVAGTNASYVTNYEYENNPSGTGTNYFVGRLKNKDTSSTAYGNTRTSEIKYTYEGSMLKKTETKGHNTDYITETYGYDGYGNLILTTTSAPGVLNRTNLIEYDENGRFIKKKTDENGLITNFNYYKWGQIQTQVDPFNVTISNVYNFWGLPTYITTSGASTTPLTVAYSYNRNQNGVFEVTSQNYQTKEYSKTFTDVLGRTYLSTARGFANETYISKKTDFDFLGRVTRESEPYFDTSTGSNTPSQWNTIQYDNLSRPITQTAFTGKTTNISYNGLSVTTSENGKTKTITKDAIGNLASVSDNGEIINYGYYATNELKTSTYNGHVVTIGIDGWGRKTSLLDPSVSPTAYTYSYNNYGETLSETTPNGVTNYTYTPTGRLNTKSVTGNNTNISVAYLYNTKGQIEQEYGTSNSIPHSIGYFYDAMHRLERKEEAIGQNDFEKLYTYDSYGRVSTETTNVGCSTCINILGANSTVAVKNNYNTYNGILDHITDNGTNATIWKLTGANQRMQTLTAQLGNGVNIANTYTTHGYIQNIRHTKSSITPLSLDYTFNAQKGTLTNRKNNFYNYTENFTYDNFDRLLSWTTPTGVESNTYQPDGRINSNSNVGSYAYDATAKYKKKNITLTTAGKNYYTERTPQTVIYNAFKKPVSITETNRGTIEFQYGINGVRNKAIEWITDTPTENYSTDVFRTKLYSSDGTVEIILNGVEAGQPDQGPGSIRSSIPTTEPFLRIITYVGGNAYSAPAMYVKTFSGSKTSPSTNSQYHYLHRDFQGSIMAITNQAGNVIERRHYDAWGNVSKFTNSSGVTQTNPNLLGGEMLFDRGYTGHEHFFRVGIIHMNGRIYDPVLKGFMSPDNFVQDPQNSQNFNRYAYCYNNPLMHTDPSGEWVVAGSAVLGAAIIGAMIGGTVYVGMALYNGEFSIGGLLKSVAIGAVMGAAGGVASSFAPIGILPGTAYGAVTGTALGGLGAALNGTDIQKGFLIGAISGGVLGGVFGGIQASELKADIWTGYRAPSEMVATPENIVNGTTPVDPTAEAARDLYVDSFQTEMNANIDKNPNIRFIKPSGTTHLKGYCIDSQGNMFNETSGNWVLGTTTQSPWMAGNSYKMYLSTTAFASKEQLSLVMAHELGHITHFSFGLTTDALTKITNGKTSLLDDWGHVAIQRMTYNFLKTNGWSNLGLSGQASNGYGGLGYWGLQPSQFNNIELINSINFLGNVKIR